MPLGSPTAPAGPGSGRARALAVGVLGLAALASAPAVRAESGMAPTAPPGPRDGGDDYHCAVPETAVDARPDGCLEGEACRWRLPDPTPASPYTIWRNTDAASLWGRPGLVGLVLGAAHGLGRLYPGERLVVGDLDAPGPRHESHRSGRDVDLYLPGAMLEENLPGARVRPNYAGRTPLEIRMLQGRVEDLAKLLATCVRGRLTILYNDPVVRDRFDRWLARRAGTGWVTSPGTMRPHNPLHRFHFHVRMVGDAPPPDAVHPVLPRGPAAPTP